MCFFRRKIKESEVFEYTADEILNLNNDFVNILNEERKRRNLGLVEFDSNLLDVVNYITKDNAKTGEISHTDSLRRPFHKRMQDFGINRSWSSEVLALGGEYSVKNPFNMWMGSSIGHRDIILNRKANKLAISASYINGGKYAYFDGISRFWGCVLTS